MQNETDSSFFLNKCMISYVQIYRCCSVAIYLSLAKSNAKIFHKAVCDQIWDISQYKLRLNTYQFYIVKICLPVFIHTATQPFLQLSIHFTILKPLFAVKNPWIAIFIILQDKWRSLFKQDETEQHPYQSQDIMNHTTSSVISVTPITPRPVSALCIWPPTRLYDWEENTKIKC